MNVDEAKELVAEMSQGNPGAMYAMVDLIKDGWMMEPFIKYDPLEYLKLLEELGILGSDIYLIHNDLCGGNVHYMSGLLKAVQLGILEGSTLKAELAKINKGGGSTIDVHQVMLEVKNTVNGFDPLDLYQEEGRDANPYRFKELIEG